MALHRVVFLVLAILVAVLSSNHVGFAQAQRIRTKTGVIVGSPSRKTPQVSEWLGVPFVQPPIGASRWMPPQPLNDSAREVVANTQAASCRGSMTFMSGSKISEDCLYVNIYAPRSNGTKKAVMLYAYGGGFETGSTSLYDASRLADVGDVVVVLTGYRLGIFGFPDAPGLQNQNLGILDFRAAVEWVHDNIAAFGGNPDKITLFGQSAGSMLLDMYTLAYKDDPKVHGVIGQSGSATSGFSMDRNHANWQHVAKNLSCPLDSGSIECLRQKSEAEIVGAVASITKRKLPAGPFSPIPDGRIVWSNADIISRSRQGLFAKVPYMFMVNSRETGLVDGRIFNCPASQAALARTKNKVPAWRVRFSSEYFTAHGAELPYVFGMISDKLSDYVMRTWGGFARDPQRFLDNQGWPKYDRNGKVVWIGKSSSENMTVVPASVTDEGCSFSA